MESCYLSGLRKTLYSSIFWGWGNKSSLWAKKWPLICLPGDGLQHLCSVEAFPNRQCPKCHLWDKAQPKTCDSSRLRPPHFAHETKMDAKMVVFPWALELPQPHWPFPYISYLGKKKTSQGCISVRTAFAGGSCSGASPSDAPEQQRLMVTF